MTTAVSIAESSRYNLQTLKSLKDVPNDAYLEQMAKNDIKNFDRSIKDFILI